MVLSTTLIQIEKEEEYSIINIYFSVINSKWKTTQNTIKNVLSICGKKINAT